MARFLLRGHILMSMGWFSGRCMVRFYKRYAANAVGAMPLETLDSNLPSTYGGI